jgi:hypothetical protein
MASSVPAVKSAVIGLLSAHAWPASKPTVTWGGPTENEDFTQEMVYMAPAPGSDEYTVLGMGRVDEAFTLPIVVDVFQYGDDLQATETRAYQVRDEIVKIIIANPGFGLPNVRTTGFRVNPSDDPELGKWRAMLVIDVDLVALELFL